MSFQYLTPAGPDKKSGTPVTLLILGGLVALVVFACVAVAAVLLLRPATGTNTEVVPDDIPSARDGYPDAIKIARQNDLQATLVSVAGAWMPTISRAALAAGRTGWTYYIYLPETHQMAAIVVDRVGSARIASTQKWQTPPDTLDDSTWAIDSGQGMAAFLQKCEGALNAAPDRQVQAWLTTAKTEGGRLAWRYTVMGPDESVVCETGIDAQTGQVKQ
jgi:hypothetical protein